MVAIVESVSVVNIAVQDTILWPKPAGLVQNELLVVWIFHNPTMGPWSFDGFTNEKEWEIQGNSGTWYGVTMRWKRAAASEPSDFTFLFGGSSHCGGVMARISGAKRTGDPFMTDTSKVASSGQEQVQVIPGITTPLDDILLFAFWGGADLGGSHGSYTDPPLTDELADIDNGFACALASGLAGMSGATGDVETTCSQTDYWFGILAGIESEPPNPAGHMLGVQARGLTRGGASARRKTDETRRRRIVGRGARP